MYIYHKQCEIMQREGNSTDNPMTDIDEAEIFQGSENSLRMEQTYTHAFQCVFQLSQYPFDTQVCFKILQDFLGLTLVSVISCISVQSFREASFSGVPPLFGHCPNSNYTPPHTQTGTLGHFFQARFYHFLPFFTIFTIFLPFFTIFLSE